MRFIKALQPKHILLISFGFIVAFLVVEIGLRLYLGATNPIEPVDCKRQDPIVHHGYKPNTTCRYKTAEWDTEIKINSHGLRNKEIGGKNKPRVLVLGDSFTAAESVGYEKTAVYLAEEKLDSESKNVDLINAGVPSYSPILEYLYLREYGLELDPDLVILNFDLGDISGDNFMSDFQLGSEKALDEKSLLSDKIETTQEKKEEPIKREEPTKLWGDTRFQLETTRAENPATLSLTTKIKFWLHTHLKSYNFFAEGVKKTIRKIKGIPEKPIYVLGDVKNDFEYVTRSVENANNREVYKVPFENLKRIKKLLNNKNIPLVVIYFPHGHQVSAKEWAKGRPFYGIDKNRVYPLDAITLLMKMSKEEQIEAYDASGAFINAKQSLFPLFYSFDGHFTENGNKVMADVLVNVIREKALKNSAF